LLFPQGSKKAEACLVCFGARSPQVIMPGVKANTQGKGKEKEKVGGGGAAGIKERKGGGDKVMCTVCRSEFNAKAARKQLQDHVDSKHSKLSIKECFPDYTHDLGA